MCIQVVGEEGVYECAICGQQFPGINLLGQHCKVHMEDAKGEELEHDLEQELEQEEVTQEETEVKTFKSL
jgi:hypothetical protein